VAFPAIAATAVTTDNTAPREVPMPAGVAAGNTLLVAYTYPSGTPSTPSGWTVIASGLVDFLGVVVAAKIATGSETVYDTGVGFDGIVGRSWRITGAHASDLPEAARAGAQTSGPVDPPSLSPAWGAADTLWMAVGIMAEDNDNAAFSAGPSGYSGFTDYQGTGTLSGLGLAYAYRELNAGSENPGAFSDSVDFGVWHGITIGIKPAAGGGGGSSQAPRSMHQYRMRRAA
jgi:hypothetical protein